VTEVVSGTSAMIGAVPPRTAPELIGRDAEVEHVRESLDIGGAGGAVLLGGDAGIGKTALVSRVIDRADDARVLVGHCVGEGGASLPYLPFVEAFGGLDARAGDLVDDLVGSRPGLVPLVPRLAAGARHDAVRADLVEAVHGALVDLGRHGPVLLVVEDVHWADESLCCSPAAGPRASASSPPTARMTCTAATRSPRRSRCGRACRA
jgi:hypothetical protein